MEVFDSTQNLTAKDTESFVTNITTATATLVKSGNCTLNGIVVNSHSSGTVEIRDGLTNAGNLKFGTITLGASERFIDFRGARFSTGMVVSTGGTVDISVLYR